MRNERHTWWVISGRASAMSLPVLARMPWWSSQLRRAYLTSPSRPFFPRPLLLTRYASKHACSRITNSLRPFDAAAPLGTCAWTGSMCGFAVWYIGFFVEGPALVLDAILLLFF